MKLKEEIQTLVLEGKVESETVAQDLFKKTGMRFMLEAEGQTLNGFINTYPREIDGKMYTLVDIFYYDEDSDVDESTENNLVSHKIKSITLDNKKIDKINKCFTLASDEIKIKLINNLGENNEKKNQ